MRNLTVTGLSLSQAQSISNLCNQKSIEIDNIIASINNTSSKITIDGKEVVVNEGTPMPSNIIELLKNKSRLHACQAFLMETIKEKDAALKSIKTKQVNVDNIEYPNTPDYKKFVELKPVDEEWGKLQLTDAEFNEFLEAESFASHIGKFIHNNGKLDLLRKELPKIEGLKWFEVEKDKKSPLIITKHHKAEDLYDLHEKLANEHRVYEQRVNYFKAKIKNLVTEENSRIARENSKMVEDTRVINEKLRADYNALLDIYSNNIRTATAKFEEDRQNEIKNVANLRIKVDTRFQSVVDELMIKEKE